MPDHGLFSASIVRQLAPHAEVHLVRVLSDYGVGDLLALTDVLGRLPAALNPRGDRRLVVNLSLVAGMPPSGEMLSLWFPHSVHDAPTVRSWHVDMARTLDFAHRSLAETISWLTAQGVLVVAAAGNDAGDAGAGTAPLPPEPRIPARYEDVLAVAAVKRSSFEPAPFSNRGDVAIMGNGVAVFGGDARPGRMGATRTTPGSPWTAWWGPSAPPPSPWEVAPTAPAGRPGPAPPSPPPSSPASPPAILSHEPELPPARVIERVREYARLSDDPLDRDGPLDCPTILATQVPAEAPTRNGAPTGARRRR